MATYAAARRSPTLWGVIRRPAPTRIARGVLLTVTSAALSVAAHGAAGGSLGEFAPALPLIVLIAGAATALADRRRRPLVILAALGSGQVAQHELLGLVPHHHAPSADLSFDPMQMTTAHVLAALCTGLLLIKADAALFALVSAVSRLLPRSLTPAAVRLVPRLRARRPAAGRVLMALLLRTVNGRRGPPVLLITRVP
jgi:hypothetical protein